MVGYKSMFRELARGTGNALNHALAIAAGLALMIAGAGMGVSVVLLPLGIPVGLAGMLFFAWGIFGWTEARKNAS